MAGEPVEMADEERQSASDARRKTRFLEGEFDSFVPRVRYE